jgi:hypothetical protein
MVCFSQATTVSTGICIVFIKYNLTLTRPYFKCTVSLFNALIKKHIYYFIADLFFIYILINTFYSYFNIIGFLCNLIPRIFNVIQFERFWDWFHRLHRTTKGANATKRIRTPALYTLYNYISNLNRVAPKHMTSLVTGFIMSSMWLILYFAHGPWWRCGKAHGVMTAMMCKLCYKYRSFVDYTRTAVNITVTILDTSILESENELIATLQMSSPLVFPLKIAASKSSLQYWLLGITGFLDFDHCLVF